MWTRGLWLVVLACVPVTPVQADTDWCDDLLRKVVHPGLISIGHEPRCYVPMGRERGMLKLVPTSKCPAAYPLNVRLRSGGSALGSVIVDFLWIEDDAKLTVSQKDALETALEKARIVCARALERLRDPACAPVDDPDFFSKIAGRIEEALSSIKSPWLTYKAVEGSSESITVFFSIDYRGIPIVRSLADGGFEVMKVPDLAVIPIEVPWIDDSRNEVESR